VGASDDDGKKFLVGMIMVDCNRIACRSRTAEISKVDKVPTRLRHGNKIKIQ
jgi:hypothetical protein